MCSCPPRAAPPHPTQHPSGVARPHVSRKPPDALLTLTFLIAVRTLPPPSYPVRSPVRARADPGCSGWGGGRSGRRPILGRRAPIFYLPRWRSKLRAAVGRGRCRAVPRLPRHGQAECLARCAGAAPLFTATCVWRLLIERGMSWNDTASTDVELQSALQFLIPLGLVCPLCRFSPSALLLCCVAHLPPDWDITRCYISIQECIHCIGIYHCYVSVGLQLSNNSIEGRPGPVGI